MNNTTWRKRFAILLNRLYLYPEPQPLPHTRLFWIAMALVTMLVILFSSFFIVYLTGLQNAYLTHAEDLGIMDQAIWNTLHGQMLHQTICNILNDTNCYSVDGISRFAIHFEPILFPVSLFYLVAPDPNTLIVLQTLVVALGAFPAFWLARLRLRNEWAAVAIAALYLLYPALQEAVVFDFHAVTFTASLLLFVLYFMYTRRTVWLFVFAVLALACKEEIPLVIAFFGLWSILFQRRWRSGLVLVGMALVWLVIWQIAVHVYSPGGRLLLAPRYGSLGHGPVDIARNILFHPLGFIKTYILEPGRQNYLRILFSPTGFLAIFAPWILILAVPSLAINMLSSSSGMYSGYFQYNAEIVPVLIFATIEALVLIVWLVQIIVERVQTQRIRLLQDQQRVPIARSIQWSTARVAQASLLALLSVYILFSVVRVDYLRGHMPFSIGFQYATVTPHAVLAQQFIDMIPPDASVSAQSSLVPHISHRANVYLFPYAARDGDTSTYAQYVFLDVTSDIYPYFSSYYYLADVKKLLLNGNYGIVAAQDGYLLLKRGLPPPGVSPYSLTRPGGMDPAFVLPNLPASFCSYINTSQQQVLHPVQVAFTSPPNTGDDMDIDLVGYNVGAQNPFSISGGYMTVSTYWHVNIPPSQPLQPVVLVDDDKGREYIASFDFPSTFWCQTNTWKAGDLIRLDSRLFGLQNSGSPIGLAHMSIALVPMVQSSSTILDIRYRYPLHIVNSSGRVSLTENTHALQLTPLMLIP